MTARPADAAGAADGSTPARSNDTHTMPIFEYNCQQCGHAFEALVRSSTVPACPNCRSTQLDKLLSVVGRVGASAVAPDAVPATSAAMAPCGTCGHPDGPGACAVN